MEGLPDVFEVVIENIVSTDKFRAEEKLNKFGYRRFMERTTANLNTTYVKNFAALWVYFRINKC